MIIFPNTFSLLYHSAIPMNISLEKIHLVLNNAVYRRHINLVIQDIESGENLYNATQKTKIFPYLVTSAIHVGEETGELDVILKNLAESLEKTLTNKLELLIAILEPLTIVGIMLVLGTVIIALYLPLFHLGAIF